ncbi:MAG TPA: ankyrin [Desulfocapsa sulfexigens]|nr:ankyrin [Desulfocapsa sulfexigens]
MEQKTKNVCPTCQGKKINEGVCECSMEWRGTKTEHGWDDCQCTPDTECPTCNGTGFIESSE